MSHTVHPYSHRLGIIRDWKSRWFSKNTKYRDALHGDITIRNYLEKATKGMFVSDIQIERGDKKIRIIMFTSRPGLVIGRSGEGVTKLRDNVSKVLAKKNYLDEGTSIKIDVEEIRSPEADAMIVAQMVADTLEKRMPFRRVLKQTVEKVMASRDVKGVRIALAGRLGGAEMARYEEQKRGQIPLQTFRADIDFAKYQAKMTYGVIGIKVWIYKGEIFDK